MRQRKVPPEDGQHASPGELDEFIDDPDHEIVLVRRNLLVALAVTGVTTVASCGGRTGLSGTVEAEPTPPTWSATGGSSSMPRPSGGSRPSTGSGATRGGTDQTGGASHHRQDDTHGRAVDASPSDSADRDSQEDADSIPDSPADSGHFCVARGGCGYCVSGGNPIPADAGDPERGADAEGMDAGARDPDASLDSSAEDAGADADAEDPVNAVCGGCRSCASCGCT